MAFCVLAVIIVLAIPLLAEPMLLHPTNPQPKNQATPSPQASQPTATPQTTQESALQTAISNGIQYFDGCQEPDALLMLNVLYRQFGVIAFADSVQTYDQIMAIDPGAAAYMRVFLRIADYNNTLQPGDMQSITDALDLITTPALYSDRTPLPTDYSQTLNQSYYEGGYDLTHVLLACIWMQDNGVQVPMPSGFVENVYNATAALVGNGSVVTDTNLEAAAFLFEAGQGALVSNDFVTRVIAVQNSDGGWPSTTDTPTPAGSYWHSSVLALMILLYTENPSNSYPPMLAPAPT